MTTAGYEELGPVPPETSVTVEPVHRLRLFTWNQTGQLLVHILVNLELAKKQPTVDTTFGLHVKYWYVCFLPP